MHIIHSNSTLTDFSVCFFFKDVVNRDIKLENILLTESQRLLKVCDFGFSKGKKDSSPKSMVGTPSYLAPEVLKNPLARRPYDGKKVDIWTCGVCLFVMLYGHYPFDDPYDRSNDRTKRMLRRIAQGRIEIPKYQYRPINTEQRKPALVSEECRDVLKRVLDPNPRTRMSMGQIMSHPWFLRGLPEGASTYNRGVELLDEPYIINEKNLQSEDDIRQIVGCARNHD